MFFVIVVFLIPYYFLSHITANDKDVGGVNVENRKRFTEMINENMLGKHIPGILAQSVEFSKMNVRSKEELTILMRIKQDERVKESIPKMRNDDKTKQVQVKPICLLMGYMYNLLEDSDLQNKGISDDLEQILRTFPSFFDILLT